MNNPLARRGLVSLAVLILVLCAVAASLWGLSGKLPATGDMTEGIEIVWVYRTAQGQPPVTSPPIITTTLRYMDAHHYSLVEERGADYVKSDGGVFVRQVISGSARTYQLLDSQQTVLTQDTVSMAAPSSEAEALSTAAFAAALTSIASPSVDVARVVTLTNQGLITETETSTAYGRTTKTYEIPDSVVEPAAPFGWRYFVQVAVENQVKLDVTTVKADGSTRTHEVISASFAEPISMEEFRVDPSLDTAGSLVESEPLEQVEPGMEDVLVVVTDTICADFAVGAARLVTETLKTNGTKPAEVTWAVFTPITRAGTAVGEIIQAPDGQYLYNTSPIRLPIMEYWPAYWESDDATENSNGWFVAKESCTLYGNVPADVYSMKDPTEVPGRGILPEYRHVITWLEGGTTRVVAVEDGSFENKEQFINCISAFREYATMQ